MDTKTVWKDSLSEAHQLLEKLLGSREFIESCDNFAQHLVRCYQDNGTVFICGNGGSHCDAMHFAEEMTGRYRKERKPLGALALGDPSHTTCVSNDYGFEHVFSRQLLALARPGDLLVGLSTSGNSQNIVNAVEAAKGLGLRTVGLLGRDGGRLKDMVDLSLVVPAETSDRIQEVHIKLIHTAIEAVERELFPENY